jgi:hypothetical protein
MTPEMLSHHPLALDPRFRDNALHVLTLDAGIDMDLVREAAWLRCGVRGRGLRH